MLKSLITLALTGASLVAQTAPSSTLVYGDTCGPSLEAVVGASIGQTMEARLSNLASNFAVVLVGVQSKNVDLTVIGAPGCRLLVADPVSMFPTYDPTTPGEMDFFMAIPNNASLVGMKIYTQAVVRDLLAPRTLKWSFSEGIEWTVEQ